MGSPARDMVQWKNRAISLTAKRGNLALPRGPRGLSNISLLAQGETENIPLDHCRFQSRCTTTVPQRVRLSYLRKQEIERLIDDTEEIAAVHDNCSRYVSNHRNTCHHPPSHCRRPLVNFSRLQPSMASSFHVLKCVSYLTRHPKVSVLFLKVLAETAALRSVLLSVPLRAICWKRQIVDGMIYRHASQKTESHA